MKALGPLDHRVSRGPLDHFSTAEVRAFAEARIAALALKLERSQPIEITERLRGEIAANRYLLRWLDGGAATD